MTTIICIRVEDATNAVPGSIIDKCHRCGRDIYLAPTGQQMGETAEKACIQCMRHEGGLEEDTVADISQEQRKELEQATGRPFTVSKGSILKHLRRFP